MKTAGERDLGGVAAMEWRKLRTVRSTWWILAVFAAGTLGYAVMARARRPNSS